MATSTVQAGATNLGGGVTSYGPGTYVSGVLQPPTVSTPVPSSILTGGGALTLPPKSPAAINPTALVNSVTPPPTPQPSSSPNLDAAIPGVSNPSQLSPSAPGYNANWNPNIQPQSEVEQLQTIQNALKDQLASEMGNQPSVSELTNRVYNDYGVQANLQQVQSLKNQLAQLQGQYNIAAANTETKGIQSGTPSVFYQGEEAAIQRQGAVIIGAKASELAAAQGNYTLSKQIADQTVQLQFQDEQQRIDNIYKFIQLNESELSAAKQREFTKQATDAQNALDEKKSAMGLQLQYPQAGITSADTLVQAAQKASEWLAKNPYAGQKPIQMGSHEIVDPVTGAKTVVTDYALQNPDGSLTPISSTSKVGNTNLGTSTGYDKDLGVPIYNTYASNPGINIPTRDNNPGAIEATSTSVKLPGVWGIDASPNGNKYLIFDNQQSGRNAISTVLTTYDAYQNVKAGQAIKRYNGNGSYSASDLGLDPSKDLQQQLKDPNLLNNVVSQIAVHEGFTNSSSNDVSIASVGNLSNGQPAFTPAKAGVMSPDGEWMSGSKGNWIPTNNIKASTDPYASFLAGRSDQAIAAFDAMPEAAKATVQQLVSGDALLSDLVRSRGIQGTAQIQQLINEARKVDPTFSVNENKVRYNFMQNWNNPNGNASKTRNSINTALGHLAEVKQMSEALNPSDLQWINRTKNWVNTETGSDAITNLQFGISQLASEIATIYKNGTAPSEMEIRNQTKILGDDFSKAQWKGVLNTAASFLSSKITASRYQYKTAMGKEYDQSIIDPDKYQALVDAGIDPNRIAKENIPQSVPAGTIVASGGKQYIVDALGNLTQL